LVHKLTTFFHIHAIIYHFIYPCINNLHIHISCISGWWYYTLNTRTLLVFKLSLCSECCILSSGQFPGAGKLPRRKHATYEHFLHKFRTFNFIGI
jgi:hypothetical protein